MVWSKPACFMDLIASEVTFDALVVELM